MTRDESTTQLAYEKHKGQIAGALREAIRIATIAIREACPAPSKWNTPGQNGWWDALKGEMPTEEDFCIFASDTGYMVIALWYYRKLSKKDRKLIDNHYDYKRIPHDTSV